MNILEEEPVVDSFYLHCQHSHWDQKFCHSHGCEALGFLTWPCSCQRHTFTQGFLGSPHFLSVQALIPIPFATSLWEGVLCQTTPAGSGFAGTHLWLWNRFGQKRNLCRSWKVEAKEQPLFSKVTERENDVCPAHAHCFLHCCAAAKTTDQQHPTAHTGMLGHQPSGATVIENNVSWQHLYQSCPDGICLPSQSHYDVQKAHHRVSLATFLQFPSSSFHTLSSLASPTVVLHDTPSNSPCLIKRQLPYGGGGGGSLGAFIQPERILFSQELTLCLYVMKGIQSGRDSQHRDSPVGKDSIHVLYCDGKWEVLAL